MGTSFQSVAVRSASAADIKTTLVRWLSHKGFQLRTEEPLFDCDPQHERGLCLISNEQWTVVLYSHQFEEGERLLHELHRHPWPVLQIWVYDSDIWGYDLYHDAEKVAAFNSNPRYFGDHPEPPTLSTNGDPELLCDLCKLGPLEDRIYRLQKQRAIFRETVCRQFCMTLGASPAGMGYRDIEENEVEPIGIRLVGGFVMEHMRFALVGSDAGEAALPLHAVPLQPSPDQPEGGQPANVSPEWTAYVQAYQRRMQVLMWFLRPLLFLLMLSFRFYFWLRRIFLRERFPGEKSFAAEEQDEFYKAYFTRGQPTTRMERNSVINERYHCRITLPPDVACLPSFGRGFVFNLKLHEIPVHCTAMPPENVGQVLRMFPAATVTHDEKFMVGPFQARQIRRIWHTHERSLSYCSTLIQTPRVLFHFTFTTQDEVLPEHQDLLRQVVESFRMP